MWELVQRMQKLVRSQKFRSQGVAKCSCVNCESCFILLLLEEVPINVSCKIGFQMYECRKNVFFNLVCIGSFGVHCVSPCPEGYYGIKCLGKCQCSDCDSITGECSTVLTETSTKTTGKCCCCFFKYESVLFWFQFY